jgi:hypothetical protein
MRKLILASCIVGSSLAFAIAAGADSQGSGANVPFDPDVRFNTLVYHPSVPAIGTPSEIAKVKLATRRLISQALMFGAGEVWAPGSSKDDAGDEAKNQDRRKRLADIWAPEKVDAEEHSFEKLIAQTPATQIPERKYFQTRFDISEWNEIAITATDARIYATGQLVDFNDSSEQSSHKGQYQIHLTRKDENSPWLLENYSILETGGQG